MYVFITNRRSYARTFFVEGAYHFLFSSVNESVKSVTSSIIVETPQSSNSVQLSRDGFTPTVTTIAQVWLIEMMPISKINLLLCV